MSFQHLVLMACLKFKQLSKILSLISNRPLYTNENKRRYNEQLVNERDAQLRVSLAFFDHCRDQFFFNFNEEVVDLVIVYEVIRHLALSGVSFEEMLRIEDLRDQVNLLLHL
jgi:hypothetical protein